MSHHTGQFSVLVILPAVFLPIFINFCENSFTWKAGFDLLGFTLLGKTPGALLPVVQKYLIFPGTTHPPSGFQAVFFFFFFF